MLALPYEIWRDIPGYEGLYQISNLGRVKSLNHLIKHLGGERLIKGKVLAPRKNKNNGYLYIILSKDGTSKTKTIHRIVSQVFINNPNNLPEVDHINRDRTDNRVNNLRWVDRLTQCKNKNYKNIADAVKITGKKNSKPVLQYTLDNIFVAEYQSAAEAARQTGFNAAHISKCCNGKKYKKVGNFIWKFKQK